MAMLHFIVMTGRERSLINLIKLNLPQLLTIHARLRLMFRNTIKFS